ncbi:50S ribosomal protein L33 [Cohnella terricola]|uniref:50S ribosomal protein L33 n=1 Tax=Cohnella terricola TaxID=1289167 RepID=A0A559JEK0_9BACL|nr:50S ribosomal protein L33 [Cohnella terricola]TVX98287.1 50S ribosomal protein L33 [Cohnella terricola]
MSRVTRSQAQKLVGKQIYAVRKDGTVATGKLASISGNTLILEQPKNKKVQTKALLSLALLDLFTVGAVDGGFGWGYPGYGYDGYGYGYGYDGWL